MKYLLLFAVLGVVWWVFSKRHAAGPQKPAARPDPAPEKMVTCASCGVHLPESESVREGGRIYCCDAHRKQAQAEGK